MPESNVLAVVEGFADWSKPWRVLETVLTHQDLSEADRIVVRGIWGDVCHAVHWQGRDLFDGSEAANRALKSAHPWLSLVARAHFVRAASYEWQ
jgi:hypothetical protein